jgi:hypothetical protein
MSDYDEDYDIEEEISYPREEVEAEVMFSNDYYQAAVQYFENGELLLSWE